MTESFGIKQDIRRTVLVVDDEMINRRILGHILSLNYEVIYAEDGIHAMDQIKSNVETLSLVMLDLLMPEMDGYQVLAELQKMGLINRIPVIVLTSEKNAEVKCLKLGASDFISKPYDTPEVILARVQRLIALAESHMVLDKTERDSLTGLYNNEFFMQYCSRIDSFNPEAQMDAVAININKLRVLNELYGRAYGDNVMKEVSEIASSYASAQGGIAGRYVADVFYLYISHQERLDALIESINSGLKKAFPETNVSVRLGVYENADRSIEPELRFDRANSACGKKRSGLSTTVEFYDTELHDKEMFRERLTQDFDNAIAQKQFKVFYQPKYDVTGDKPRLVSAEALIRWIHPELGFISPGVFIPLFEENGLVNKLDRFVWSEAAKKVASLKEKLGKTVPVSVNVSRVDIYDQNLESFLLDIIKENSLDTGDLLLEITESAYTDNASEIIETVNKLRAHGFHVEMDDFGTGYSSLNMLTSLPIDTLKLDMLFVRRICESEKDLKMVQLVIEIAKYLDLKIIAEGVETEQQYMMLKEAGCDVIQGYYFSRPVPADEFEKIVGSEV